MNPNDHVEVSRLLGVFSEQPTEVLDSDAQARRKAAVVSHIREVLKAPRHEPLSAWRTIRWTETTAVLAMAAGLTLVVGHYWTSGEKIAPISALRALEARGEILCDRNDGKSWTTCNPKQTAGLVGLRTLANASLSAETLIGVRLDLDPSSTLFINDREPSTKSSQVTLAEGRVDVHVPKLGSGREFSVLTPNATVTVHGTAFSVTVRRASEKTAPHTCVELREGVISVTSEGRIERLTAPASWGCDEVTTDNTASGTTTTVTAPETGIPTQPTTTADTARARSTLALQTRLLQTALGAERRKDFTSAEKSLRSLLSTYPNSVVAPEARAALERIAAHNSANR